MADTLINQGYDIVILNFPEYLNQHGVIIDGGADFIERNGLVLVELINQVNQKLTTNGSNEELIIIGPSMGGQVSRYALAYMEQNNMDHNTRLWVSFDSPHPSSNLPLGANINYGAQSFLRFFGEVGGIEASLDTWQNTVCSNAAKQMLINHRLSYTSPPYPHHPYHQTFINSMNQMGFPIKLRKVSVANGSLNGTLFNSPCQLAYELEVNLLYVIPVAQAHIFQQPAYGNPCGVFGVFSGLVMLLLPDPEIKYATEIVNVTGNQGTCSFDVAPGGTFKTYQEIKESASNGSPKPTTNNALLESHSFISTKSALAFTGSNPDLAENLSGRNLVSTGETPFDAYWGPINKNMEHISFDSSLLDWLMDEVTCAPILFENRTISSNRYFKGCEVSVRNVTVENSAKLTIEADDLVINGEFQVMLGTSLEIR